MSPMKFPAKHIFLIFLYSEKWQSDTILYLINSGCSPGRAGGPAGCGRSKLAHARTGLPLTSVQFISCGGSSHKIRPEKN